MMSKSSEKSLSTSVKFAEQFPTLINPERINNLAEGEQLTFADLVKVTVPTGGGLTWTVEKLTGQESVKELTGIILGQILSRSLYAKSFEETGGQEPPVCFSKNSINGDINHNEEFSERLTKIGYPAGTCRDCPFSQWGTKLKGDGSFGRGQMCQQRRVLLFLTPKTSIPVLVSIPAGGMKNSKRYLSDLQEAGLTHWQVITNIGLMPDKNADGIKFSRPTFTLGGIIPQECREQITTYMGNLKNWLMTN